MENPKLIRHKFSLFRSKSLDFTLILYHVSYLYVYINEKLEEHAIKRINAFVSHARVFFPRNVRIDQFPGEGRGSIPSGEQSAIVEYFPRSI